MRVDIKPLSVNQAWKGRRFKTKEYIEYQKELLYKLKPMDIPKGKLKLTIVYGLSSKASDLDNPTKLCADILSKKYGFNDKMIYELNTKKVDVLKGCEFIEFHFEKYTE